MRQEWKFKKAQESTYFIISSRLRIFIESFVINILFVTQPFGGGYSSTSRQSIPQDAEVPPHVEGKRVIS
jgi:hypothetical protein